MMDSFVVRVFAGVRMEGETMDHSRPQQGRLMRKRRDSCPGKWEATQRERHPYIDAVGCERMIFIYKRIHVTYTAQV